MVAQRKLLSPREHLNRRIAALDAEVEQIRAEYGDPAEALGRYLVERFGIDAIMETYRDFLDHEEFARDEAGPDEADPAPEESDGGEPA